MLAGRPRHAGAGGPRGALAASLLLLAAITGPIEATGGQLSLSWIDASASELGFWVERSVGGEDAFAVLATTGPGVTAYTDTTVAAATTYCYRVRAFKRNAYSDYSFPACATTAPTALTLALTSNQAAFALGDRLQLDVRVTDGGSAAVADVYVGSVLPSGAGPALGCMDGDAVVYLIDPYAGVGGLLITCAAGEEPISVPLYLSVSVGDLPGLMGADFFSFHWPQTTPGNHTIFMIVTEAGTTNVIAQGSVTVSYTP
jgi:hypothetical protein